MLSAILLIFLNFCQGAQSSTIISADLKINGLSFSSTKEDIIKTFGEPVKIFQPRYECGFLSEDEQGAKYYTLDYGSFKFTGNKGEGYILENALMSVDSKMKITYQGRTLSGNTTLKELEELFKTELNRSEIKVFFKDRDDALIFSIVNDKLIRIMYWSPC